MREQMYGIREQSASMPGERLINAVRNAFAFEHKCYINNISLHGVFVYVWFGYGMSKIALACQVVGKMV